MKGKKFDAHEKHFKEKEIKLNKDNNEVKKRWADAIDQNMELSKENVNLKKENLELLEKYEEILKYSKLSDEEINESIKSYKAMNNVSSLFKLFPSYYS